VFQENVINRSLIITVLWYNFFLFKKFSRILFGLKRNLWKFWKCTFHSFRFIDDQNHTWINWSGALQLIQDQGVSKSFRTGRLERELQIVQLSAT